MTARPAMLLSFLLVATLSVGGCHREAGFDGRSDSAWILALGSPARSERIKAAIALQGVLRARPNSQNAIDALTRALGDTADSVRLAAAKALLTEGVDVRGATSGLTKMLHDSAHAGVREAVALLIGTAGPARVGVLIPSVAAGLNDLDPEVRQASLAALGMMGSSAASQQLAIATLSSDPSSVVRVAVLRTLRMVNGDTALVSQVASALLRDSVPGVRSAAARTLGGLGHAPARSLKDLMRGLDDKDPDVRSASAWAIGRMPEAGVSARPALRRLLQDPFREVRDAAGIALSRMDSICNVRNSTCNHGR